MIILGIDPGLASTGFGAIDCGRGNPTLLRCGHIKTSSSIHISKRIYQIYLDVSNLFDAIKPDLVAVENVVYSLARYPRAGIMLGSVLGVLYLIVEQNHLPLAEVAPKEIKNSLAAYGSANKNQLRLAVQKALNIVEKTSFHAADALGVALTVYYRGALKRSLMK